jgi:hypothetical protein
VRIGDRSLRAAEGWHPVGQPLVGGCPSPRRYLVTHGDQLVLERPDRVLRGAAMNLCVFVSTVNRMMSAATSGLNSPAAATG